MATCLNGHHYDPTCFLTCPSCYPMESNILPDETIRHDLDGPAERAKLARREAWVKFMAALASRGFSGVNLLEELHWLMSEYDKRIAEGKL